MKTWLKVLLVTLVVGIPAFVLGPILWPPHGPTPTPGQLPFFIFLALLEGLLFGLGIAFIIFGLPLVRRVVGDTGISPWPTFVSITWLLVSWWPHDNLHIHTAGDMSALLLIEYGFHFTLMICALVLALSFVRILQRAAPPTFHAAQTAAAEQRLGVRGR